MTRKVQYLKPGFLVVGDIKVTGCASYSTANRSQQNKGDREDREWQTHLVIKSKTEQIAVGIARKVLISKLLELGTCIYGFGYVVPLTNKAKLEEVLKKIEMDADIYNAQARYTKLDAFFAVFEISSSDERVAAALYKRTVELLDLISKHVAEGNVGRLRSTFRSMQGLDLVLPTETASKVSALLEKARSAAKEAVKQSKKVSVDQVEKTIKNVLRKGIPINSIRADLVEISDKMTAQSRKAPAINPVDARQIE